jgi:hypothetical protein
MLAVGNEIKWCVFAERYQHHITALHEIRLRFRDPEITLVFCMMGPTSPSTPYSRLGGSAISSVLPCA